MFSSTGASLKDETRSLLLWDNSLVTLHTFMFIHITSVLKPVYIYMAESKASKRHIINELWFHRFVHFGCLPIFIFGFHHKHCDSNYKDFTFVRLTSQMFSSNDEPLKAESQLLLLRDGSLVTAHLCVHSYNICSDTSAHLYSKVSNF